MAVFERLTEGFENIARKFGYFVEEKDTEMGERDFTWIKMGTAAKYGGEARSVVWRAERPRRNELGRRGIEGIEFC